MLKKGFPFLDFSAWKVLRKVLEVSSKKNGRHYIVGHVEKMKAPPIFKPVSATSTTTRTITFSLSISS